MSFVNSGNTPLPFDARSYFDCTTEIQLNLKLPGVPDFSLPEVGQPRPVTVFWYQPQSYEITPLVTYILYELYKVCFYGGYGRFSIESYRKGNGVEVVFQAGRSHCYRLTGGELQELQTVFTHLESYIMYKMSENIGRNL